MRPFNAATDPLQDERLGLARPWLLEHLTAGLDDLSPASADASFRRYFRVASGGQTCILMDAPPDKEPLGPFLQVAAWLEACGVHVPQVLAADEQRGLALLSDLGSEPYLGVLQAQPGRADQLYRDALDTLVRLQAEGARYQARLPPYDAKLLAGEVELFREWCCRRHLGLVLTPQEERMLDAARERLCDAALAQPTVFVHRDYHSRNLMVLAEGNPGVLDFQDAVCGPVSYDVVSLLKDCYVVWPHARRLAWLAHYHDRAAAAGVEVGDFERFVEWQDWMGVQRHLKAAGIFARLSHRDGKHGYLADIPRTLGYVQEAARTLPSLAPLGDFLAQRVVPELEGS